MENIDQDRFISRAMNGDFEPYVTKLDGFMALEKLAQCSAIMATNSSLMIAIMKKHLNLPPDQAAEMTQLAGEQIEAMTTIAGLIAPLEAKLATGAAE